jgi:DNA repair exonuclease SbcCD nuclease subunit
MRFIHTADLHLKKDEETRLEIFGWLLKKAGELRVDYFLIAGDLFDSDTDATLLRQEVRRRCESARFKFLFLPGNHDARSYGPEYEYGNNVIQLSDRPFHLFQSTDLRICGVPYEDGKFSDCIKDMPHDVDVLIAHGTVYDRSFIFSLLEDQETKYMPIFPIDLENIARYVAMGHLHTSRIELRYEGTHVVYPGSPIAIDSKCVGTRCFYVLNIDKKNIEIEKHDVEIAPYWIAREFFVYPGVEKTILDSIEDYLRNLDAANTMPNITVTGYIGEQEKKYLDLLSGIQQSYAGRFPELRINAEIQSWDKLMSNPLIQNFVHRTEGLGDELRLKIFEITFPIFSKALK